MPEEFDELGSPIVPEQPDVPESEQQVQQPDLIDRVQGAKDQLDQGKELYQKGKEKLAARAEHKAGAGGAKEGLKGVEKKGAQAAKRKVATQGAEQIAKVGAKTAVTTGAKAGGTAAVLGAEAATGPVGWIAGVVTLLSIIGRPLWNGVKKYGVYFIYALAALLILPAIIFGLLGLKNADIKSSTPAQKQQATLVAAVAGDFTAGKKVTQEGVDRIKSHYQDLIQTARIKNAARAAEAEKKFKVIETELDQLIGLSGEPQKKLLAQIKAEENQLFKDFLDLFPVGGNCADLKPFIDSGQFDIGTIGRPNAKNIVAGKLANKAGEVWPASPGLCATLVYLLKNGVKIGTNTLSLGHEKYSGNKTSGTTISQHWCGEAIDIQTIDGVPVNKNEPTRKAMKLIKQAWTAKVGAYESFGPFYDLQLNNGRSYTKNIGGHDTHIHLAGSVTNRSCYGK